MRRMILQIDETNEKRVEYKLQPMNKKERQFVHELSDLYNIYSTGRDIEPNRYLVLIAEKGNISLQFYRKNLVHFTTVILVILRTSRSSPQEGFLCFWS